MIVEQVSYEGQVKLVNALEDILKRDEALTAPLLDFLEHEHDLSSVQQVALHQRFLADCLVERSDVASLSNIGGSTI